VKNCTSELWQHLETSRIYTEPLQIPDRNGGILHYHKAYSWPSHPQLLPGFESVGLCCTVINFGGPDWPGLWATVLTAGRPGPLGTLLVFGAGGLEHEAGGLRPPLASPAPMARRRARHWYSALGSGFGNRH